MRLVLKREIFEKDFTKGRLWIDGAPFCDTIEDTVRDGEKVHGETAVPAGQYDVVITWSPRFRKTLPLVLRVPGFEGIRIHSGNTAEDSEGCIIVGDYTKRGWVSNSRATMTRLMAKLESASAITLEII